MHSHIHTHIYIYMCVYVCVCAMVCILELRRGFNISTPQNRHEDIDK